MLKDIVSILQVGFAGFAFLMASLSFRLLRDEAKRDGNARPSVLKAISRYTNYTLVMAILVSASRFGEAWYSASLRDHADRIYLRSKEVRTCRDGLERLVSASAKTVSTVDSLQSAIQQDVAGCQVVLDHLSEGSFAPGE